MLTNDGHWHAGEVYSSQMNPRFNCTGQMTDVWRCGDQRCQHGEQSAPWWRWGYGIGRHKLQTTNTIALYQWQFECSDTVMRSWGPLLCHSSTTWPAYSPDMSLIEHVWDALDRCVKQRVPVPANIQQLCIAIEEEWDNFPQATINSLINSMKEMCRAAWCKWWSHQILTGFLIHTPTFKVYVTNRCSHVKSID